MRSLQTTILLLLVTLLNAGCGGGGNESATKALGEACGLSSQCLSGHCIATGGGVCSQSCEAGGCPAGMDCRDIGEGRGDWCVPMSDVCLPDCAGRQCGPDPACGESCGACVPGGVCADGVCACERRSRLDCVDSEVWWLDSCGVPESRVAACPQACVEGQCIDCTPDCGSLECGPDPVCGASCGTCLGDQHCDAGTCAGGPCVRQCAGKVCGDDGCGGTCGACDTGATCQQGACVGQPDDCRTTGCAGFNWCDTASGECQVGCGIDAQCGDHERCDQPTHACVCDTDYVRCGVACVNTASDPDHCGRCERVCNDGQVCQEADCHVVGDCRDEGCPGDYYCDLATGACHPGCAFDDQCGANEECDTAAHACVCLEDFHRCGGACVSDDSVDHCGASCTPCASDPNGTVACRDEGCWVTCDPAFEFCAGRCAACPSSGVAGTRCDGADCVAASCAATHELCLGDCALCPTTGVQTTACDGAACVPATCRTGYRLCGGACATCPTTGVSATVCDGGACVASTCANGYRICGGACSICPTSGVFSTTCEGAQCVAQTCHADHRMCDGTCVPCPTQHTFATACSADGVCKAFECADGYYPCGGQCCAWTVEAPFEWDSEAHGASPSIGTDASNRPHVVFAHYGRDEIVYTRRSGGAWQSPTTVDNTTASSDSTSDLVVQGGTVHVVFHQGAGTAYTTRPVDGTAFSYPVRLVDDPFGAETSYLSLAVKGDGYPIVCWEEYHWNVGTALHCKERTADTWLDEESVISVDASSFSWGRKPIAAHGGMVHIAFGRITSDARLMTRPTWAPPAEPQWVEDTDLPSVRHVDLVLDTAGRPHLCGASSSGLLLYVWKDATGWHDETVATAADLGGTPECSIALDSQGRPHIAWTDGTPAVGYATRGAAASSWALSTVTATAGDSTDLDLALDGQQRPHVVWFDLTNGDLRYATGGSRPQVP